MRETKISKQAIIWSIAMVLFGIGLGILAYIPTGHLAAGLILGITFALVFGSIPILNETTFK